MTLRPIILWMKGKYSNFDGQRSEKGGRVFGIQNLSDPDNMTISHHINQALRAHGLMKRDRDYVVKMIR